MSNSIVINMCYTRLIHFYLKSIINITIQARIHFHFKSITNILNSVSLRFHPGLSLLISSLIIHYQYWDFCWDWLQMKFIIHIMISFGKTEDVLITCSVSLLIHHHASDISIVKRFHKQPIYKGSFLPCNKMNHNMTVLMTSYYMSI